MYAVIVCEPQDGGEIESFICEDEEQLEYFQMDADWVVLSIKYMGA
jgi:hypothetical protein